MRMDEHYTPNPFTAGIEGLNPAYFALVMATGIVAVAAQVTGFPWIAIGLGAANYFFAAVLGVCYALRGVLFPGAILRDLREPKRAVGFLTLVAGVCILGNQSLLIFGSYALAAVFLVAGVLLWVVCLYGVLAFLTLSGQKADIEHSLHGGWLVLVVATQAVSVLLTLLAPQWSTGSELGLFTALCFWLAAGMLYIWIISLIFYRYTFFTMRHQDILPPYWINTGAMAISTLAGCVLIAAAPESRLLSELKEFITGGTLLFWATATWWIPFLLLLGVWRHGVQRAPITYDPAYWSMVFPLGMYTVCTWRLAQLLALPELLLIPRITIYVSFFAWGAAIIGLVLTLAAMTRQARAAKADAPRSAQPRARLKE